MPKFPETFYDFQRQFATDDACFAYVADLRWPGGFKCVNCGGKTAYARPERKAVQCTKCRSYASITAGTVMEKSHIPICKWLLAAWMLVSSKGGIAAIELARQIGVSDETAHTMLHKLRHAMVDPDRSQLNGVVEVDETYIGAPHSGPRGRGALGKVIVVGAIEAGTGRPIKRLRLRAIEDAKGSTLELFVRDAVALGSTVETDGNPAYNRLSKIGYKHAPISTAWGAEQDDVLPALHVAFSNLKSWIRGTLHGSFSAKHLQAYLNEFVFRFNRRKNLAAAFARILGLAGEVGTLTYADIYSDAPPHRNPL